MDRFMTAYDIDPNQVEPRRLKLAITTSPEAEIFTPHLIKDLWKIRIDKMVQKVKELSSSQWASPILLSLLIGYTVWTNQSYNATLEKQNLTIAATHDLLIKLETLHEVEEKEKIQEKIDKNVEKDEQRIYRELQTKAMNRLELIVTGKYPSTLKGEN